MFRDFKSDHDTLLNKAGINTLHLNRLRCLATEVYNCTNNISPSYMKVVFRLSQSNYDLRSKENIALEYSTIHTQFFGKHSLRSLAPRIWNDLPADCRKAVSLNNFKKLINTWQGVKCKCALCNL